MTISRIVAGDLPLGNKPGGVKSARSEHWDRCCSFGGHMRTKMTYSCALALVFGAIALLAGRARAEPLFACIPINVVEIVGSRVHAECSNSIVLNGQTITWVAIGTTNADTANRFVTLANAAFLNGKVFLTAIPETGANNVAGCSVENCRTPVNFGISN